MVGIPLRKRIANVQSHFEEVILCLLPSQAGRHPEVPSRDGGEQSFHRQSGGHVQVRKGTDRRRQDHPPERSYSLHGTKGRNCAGWDDEVFVAGTP